MTMTKMATLMYMMRMMTKTLVMTVTLIILMAARRTVMMMVLSVAVMGTKATIANKLYVKVDPNNKIKLKFMLESSRALIF